MIIPAIIGLLGSALPHALEIFSKAQDNKQELAILNLQMQMQASGAANKLAEIAAQADIAETTAIYKTYSTGISWVDALNGTVRPVLMYAFFILYSTVKLCQYNTLVDISSPFDKLAMLWTVFDMEIFATMITFFYGSRTFAKMRQGK